MSPLNNVPPWLVSPSEDVQFSNVPGLYLRKYGMLKMVHTLKSSLRLITYFEKWLSFINLATLKLFNCKKSDILYLVH